MKARLGREVLLLCAPLLLVGGVFAWSQWQKRGRTPRVKMAIRGQDAGPAPDSGFGSSPDETLRFNWSADLSGGPKSSYRFGWNEQIVATTRSGKVVVWRLNALPRGWMTNAVGGTHSSGGVSLQFNSFLGLNRCIHDRQLDFDGTTLPLDTQKLEWRGEMVAIPSDDGEVWQSPLSSSALQGWRHMKGEAHWTGTFPLRLGSLIANPVVMRAQKSREPVPSSKNEIEVEMLFRKSNRRVSRRLVAFDGSKRRVLWTEKDPSTFFRRSIGSGGYSAREGETLGFDVGAVPQSWGEVALECDTVFDTSNRAPTASGEESRIGERELAQFQQRTGGLRVSRRLVLRSRPRPKRA
jgi:hypothetical protein